MALAIVGWRREQQVPCGACGGTATTGVLATMGTRRPTQSMLDLCPRCRDDLIARLVADRDAAAARAAAR